MREIVKSSFTELRSGIEQYEEKSVFVNGFAEAAHRASKAKQRYLHDFFHKRAKKFFKKQVDFYTANRTIGIMTMIRKAILKRMDELNINPNQLSEMLKGNIPRMTIYDFLTGKSDARTEVASEIMKALGLTITYQKKKKAGEK